MDFLRFLFNPVRRLWQLVLGYEGKPVYLNSGLLTYTVPAGQCIYAFVSISADNTITTATNIDGGAVLVGDTPFQGYEVKCRLSSITFTAITGTVIVYVKNIKDEA